MQDSESWRGKEYSYFCHKTCEAFPCHETEDKENFNCLFCYCPLYLLGMECGGKFIYLQNGVKDCSGCDIPHNRENYGIVRDRLKDEIGKRSLPPEAESQRNRAESQQTVGKSQQTVGESQRSYEK